MSERKKATTGVWLKIAASITILAVLSLAVYLAQTDPTYVQVASSDDNVTVTFPDGSYRHLEPKF